MDRNELKIQALRERVAQLTTEYEDKVADLRVELTLVSAELEQYKAQTEGSDEPLEEGTLS